MLFETIGFVWILTYIQRSEAIFSKSDIRMPTCDEEGWRHVCQNDRFYRNYACTKRKFGANWRNALPHTKDLIDELKLRQESLRKGSLRNTNDYIGSTIIAKTISDPLKFWARIVKHEVTQQEVPENYLGELAMNYRDPDLIKIIASFFPIQDITAQKGAIMGNEVGFTNTTGCVPEDDVYLLQNKETYLEQFEEDSTKQAQVDYEALIQFINSLAKALEKK